jgi:hypothetical protein
MTARQVNPACILYGREGAYVGVLTKATGCSAQRGFRALSTPALWTGLLDRSGTGPARDEPTALLLGNRMNERARYGSARGDLRLRPTRGLAQVSMSDQRNQKHDADIAERV